MHCLPTKCLLLEADSNVAIVSRTTPSPGASGLLATYRCQEVTNRLEVRVRTTEGRYGNLQAFVWPRISPKTCCAATCQRHTRAVHRLSPRFSASPLLAFPHPRSASLLILGRYAIKPLSLHSRMLEHPKEAELPEAPATPPRPLPALCLTPSAPPSAHTYARILPART